MSLMGNVIQIVGMKNLKTDLEGFYKEKWHEIVDYKDSSQPNLGWDSTLSKRSFDTIPLEV